MGTGTSRRSISSLELTYSCIYVYISVYFYLELMEGQVVPEFLRTLVFARPRGDDQFADCTFSPSLDMSR